MTFTKKDLENQLSIIEDKKNYYAGFPFIMKLCNEADFICSMLAAEPDSRINDVMCYRARIHDARKLAIATHKDYVTKLLQRTSTKHTLETLIATVYNAIFE